MHLELVSQLRCTVPHADGWLVASVSRVHDRYIHEGELGCPICGAEYAIRGGVTYMSGAETDATTTSAPIFGTRENSPQRHAADEPSEMQRVAAFLGVSDPMQTFALVGHEVADAEQLQEMLPVRCFVINPPSPRAPTHSQGPSGVIMCTNCVPLAVGQLSGVAYTADHGNNALVSAAVRALKQGGRMCAPASVPMPEQLSELARDERQWVAQRAPVATTPITITRR